MIQQKVRSTNNSFIYRTKIISEIFTFVETYHSILNSMLIGTLLYYNLIFIHLFSLIVTLLVSKLKYFSTNSARTCIIDFLLHSSNLSNNLHNELVLLLYVFAT